jgi:hypothetical protein
MLLLLLLLLLLLPLLLPQAGLRQLKDYAATLNALN